MKLPNRENAYIPPAKLKGYLLSETHVDGRSKARFFRAFGYDEANVELLERGLLLIARNQEVHEEVVSQFGIKYVIDGSLQTPSGRTINSRTVWIIEEGEEHPRFVTAVPN
ncbi:hypothetical protein HUU05_01150 [candidate division KSB1 bacterium]|nr:hypothetical protein [candidate division KSB1 bacterium]